MKIKVLVLLISQFLASSVLANSLDLRSLSSLDLKEVKQGVLAIDVIKDADLDKLSGNSFLAISKVDYLLLAVMDKVQITGAVKIIEDADLLEIFNESGVMLNLIGGGIATVHTNLTGILKLSAHPDVASIQITSIVSR